MVAWWWSWVLTAYGVFGMYVAGTSPRYGWLLGVTAQIPWFVYATVTHQYGFYVSCLAYGGVYLRNYLRWRSNKD